MIEVELPDGTILEAPDGADPSAVAKSYLAKQQPQAPQVEPTRGRPSFQERKTRILQEMRKPTMLDTIKAQLPTILSQVPNAPALGAGEAALSMGTGAVATPIAGLAGIGQGIKNLVVDGGMSAGDRVSQVQQMLTYQPQSSAGQAVTEGVSYPFEKLAQGADWAGRNTAELTGSPLLGAGVNTALQAAPAVLLRGRMRGARANPDRPVAAPEAAKPSPAAAEKAGRPAGLGKVSDKPPSIDELKAAKDAAYKKAEDTGVVVSRGAINRLKVELVNDLKKEGLNKKLHPKTAAALEEITNTKGQLSLSQIETLRKIANDAKGAIEPGDARLGAKIVEKIDDFEANLAEADVVSGNAAAGTAFKEARALNTRLAKARTIQKLFDDAELAVGANYTAAGMDTALRQQFRSLAKNDRKMKSFTPEEQAAIRKVVMGGPVQNVLRNLGKFAPSGVVSSLAGIGAFGVAGPGGLALPAAGIVAKQGAAKMGIKNASRASELVRRGPEKKAPKNALMTADQ